MNRIILFLFLALTSNLIAQDDLKLIKDGVIMRDGKLYLIEKDGSSNPLSADTDLGGGTLISRTGEITLSGGLKTRLKEGEILLKNGGLGILQSKVKALDGFIFKDGKVMEILPSTLKIIETERKVNENNRILPDGKYYIGGGDKFVQLIENEIVTKSGEIFFSQDETATESFVIKRDAVVLKSVHNKMGIIESDYLFPNGIKVTPQGIVSTKEGLSFPLNNGEKLNSKGELFLQTTGLFNNGIVKKDGMVYMLKDGRISPIHDDLVIDSITISSKGIISYAGKPEKFVMKEGDVVSHEGKLMVANSGCADKTKKDRFILDHILFREGKLFIIKDAEASILTKEITLADGSKILKSGHIIKANGSKIQLHEGQRIALTGEDMPDDKPEESTTPEKNYLTMLRGRMWLVTDGKPALLKEEHNIQGKMIVKTNGLIQKSDGGKTQMKEGERLSLDGVMISLDKKQSSEPLPATYYIMKNGKMWFIEEGKPSKLEKDVITQDGTKIGQEGTIIKKDKTKLSLKEGDKISTKGDMLK